MQYPLTVWYRPTMIVLGKWYGANSQVPNVEQGWNLRPTPTQEHFQKSVVEWRSALAAATS